MRKYTKYFVIYFASIILLSVASFVDYNKESYTVKDLGTNRSLITFNSGNGFESDNILIPYVKEYINESIKRNINIDSLSWNYMGIYTDKTPEAIYGVTYDQGKNYKSYTLISTDILNNPSKIRLLVFHEMHHHYSTKDHCHTTCEEIMSAFLGDKNFNNDWDKQKEVMFLNKSHKSL